MEIDMRHWIVACKALLLGLTLSTASVKASEPVTGICHMSEGIPEASRGLKTFKVLSISVLHFSSGDSILTGLARSFFAGFTLVSKET